MKEINTMKILKKIIRWKIKEWKRLKLTNSEDIKKKTNKEFTKK